MKQPILLPFALGLALFASPLDAKTTIAVNGSAFTKDVDGIGAFVFEVLQSELASQQTFELVDRKKLQETLIEQSLGASGMTGEAAVGAGKLVGAQYFIYGETIQAGARVAVNCRVVQVQTGVLKPVLLPVAKDEDPLLAGARLAEKVSEAIAHLEGREVQTEIKEKADEVNFAPNPGSKLPSLAFRIPETSVTPQSTTADPAGEKNLEDYFGKHQFTMIQLSRPSQSVPAASGAFHLEGKEHEALLSEARQKGVKVLVLGIATSDLATHIGTFSAARARVEISAIATADRTILATASGYGVGTDLSDFVAEKKAIESAASKLAPVFAKQIVEAWNKHPAGK